MNSNIMKEKEDMDHRISDIRKSYEKLANKICKKLRKMGQQVPEYDRIFTLVEDFEQNQLPVENFIQKVGEILNLAYT